MIEKLQQDVMDDINDFHQERKEEKEKQTLEKNELRITPNCIPVVQNRGQHLAYWRGFQFKKGWHQVADLRRSLSADKIYPVSWKLVFFSFHFFNHESRIPIIY